MQRTIFHCRSVLTGVAALFAGLLLWPAIGAAQEVSGQARAVYANVLGTTAAFADTGTLSDENDAREASLMTANIPLGSASVLHAATVSSINGWDAQDYVASEAALGSLNLTVAGQTVSADFVMARARTPVGGASSGSSDIAGLSINGSPIAVTGEPNQTVSLIGGRLVINEQQASASGIVVNALHVVVDGVADVVVAYAASAIGAGASAPPTGPIPPLPVLGSGSLF